MDTWISICFKLLARTNLSIDLFNLVAMIMVYGCIEKPNLVQLASSDISLLDANQFILTDYFNMLENTFHLISIKYLSNADLQLESDEDLYELLLSGDQIQIWPLNKYLNHKITNLA